MEGLEAANSETACFAHTVDVGPLMSRYGPEKSVNRPILMVLAWARTRCPTVAAAAAPVPGISRLRRCSVMSRFPLIFFLISSVSGLMSRASTATGAVWALLAGGTLQGDVLPPKPE